MQYSTKAWIGLAVYLAVAEGCAPNGQLMSEAFDGWLTDRRKAVAASAVTALLVGHLFNLIPPARDPIHQTLRVRDFLRSAVESVR